MNKINKEELREKLKTYLNGVKPKLDSTYGFDYYTGVTIHYIAKYICDDIHPAYLVDILLDLYDSREINIIYCSTPQDYVCGARTTNLVLTINSKQLAYDQIEFNKIYYNAFNNINYDTLLQSWKELKYFEIERLILEYTKSTKYKSIKALDTDDETSEKMYTNITIPYIIKYVCPDFKTNDIVDVIEKLHYSKARNLFICPDINELVLTNFGMHMRIKDNIEYVIERLHSNYI
jgi:hypothetical protein